MIAFQENGLRQVVANADQPVNDGFRLSPPVHIIAQKDQTGRRRLLRPGQPGCQRFTGQAAIIVPDFPVEQVQQIRPAMNIADCVNPVAIWQSGVK